MVAGEASGDLHGASLARALIERQVTNGVAVRMALLHLLAYSSQGAPPPSAIPETPAMEVGA